MTWPGGSEVLSRPMAQPSSIQMCSYPAACSPDDTMASPMARSITSSMLDVKPYHEDHPSGGTRKPLSSADANRDTGSSAGEASSSAAAVATAE